MAQLHASWDSGKAPPPPSSPRHQVSSAEELLFTDELPLHPKKDGVSSPFLRLGCHVFGHHCIAKGLKQASGDAPFHQGPFDYF